METNRKPDVGMFASIGDLSGFLGQVDRAVLQAREHLGQAVADKINVPIGYAQGNFAESWHAETFNIDTVLNRTDHLKAMVLNSTDYKSPDIAVEDFGHRVRNYCLKYWATPKQSVDQMKEYEDQIRILPADQLQKAREILDRQILKETTNRPEVAADLKEVEQGLDVTIKEKDVHSQPLDRKQSEDYTKRLRRGEEIPLAPQYDLKVIVEESLRSGAIAAGITLAMALAPRVINAVAYRVRHKEFPPDVFEGALQEAVASAGMASLRATVATSITLSCKAGVLGESLKAISPGLVGTLTYLTFEGIKEFRKLQRGEITGLEYADSMMAKSVGATGGVIGATIGQSLIPIPIVGAMVGAMVGSVLASQGYQCLDYVTDSYFHSQEFEELKRVMANVAAEWNLLATDYGIWRQRVIAFDRRWAQQEEEFRRLEEDEAQLSVQLKRALKENGDAR